MGVGGLCENIAISKNPKNLKNVQKEISGSEEKGDFKCGPAQPNLSVPCCCTAIVTVTLGKMIRSLHQRRLPLVKTIKIKIKIVRHYRELKTVCPAQRSFQTKLILPWLL